LCWRAAGEADITGNRTRAGVGCKPQIRVTDGPPRVAFKPYLKVKMRARSLAGLPDQPDDIPCLHPLPGLDQHFGEVGIQREELFALVADVMLDGDGIAVGRNALPLVEMPGTGLGNDAVGDGEYLGANRV